MKKILVSALVLGSMVFSASLVTEASVSRYSSPTAKCRDYTYSYAASHRGACSHHGGVKTWYR